MGFRLARAGLGTATFASTTWEEAPAHGGNWLKQRTRWIKGWIITYLVHTREPHRLLRDLGWRRCLGLHVLMSSILLSVICHPLCYLLLAWEAGTGHIFSPPSGLFAGCVWLVSVVNLATGYVTGILVGALAAMRRQRPALVLHALATPLYWLLISCAGYRALVQLVRAPHVWEKTQHGARGHRAHELPPHFITNESATGR